MKDAEAKSTIGTSKIGDKPSSKIEESIGDSQSLSVSKAKDKVTESYDTDTFEEKTSEERIKTM